MHKELKNEFVEHSTFIFLSSVLDCALKISTRTEISSIKVLFSAPCQDTSVDQGMSLEERRHGDGQLR